MKEWWVSPLFHLHYWGRWGQAGKYVRILFPSLPSSVGGISPLLSLLHCSSQLASPSGGVGVSGVSPPLT